MSEGWKEKVRAGLPDLIFCSRTTANDQETFWVEESPALDVEAVMKTLAETLKVVKMYRFELPNIELMLGDRVLYACQEGDSLAAALCSRPGSRPDKVFEVLKSLHRPGKVAAGNENGLP